MTQFNSFYQAILVLSAIVFSTAGVLLGLLVTAAPLRRSSMVRRRGDRARRHRRQRQHRAHRHL
ncbi:MAG: hypothetical protein U5L11_08280 [Arhodomonas sp.]|nr:hypothetical protein [Arhodomonas sp.]